MADSTTPAPDTPSDEPDIEALRALKPVKAFRKAMKNQYPEINTSRNGVPLETDFPTFDREEQYCVLAISQEGMLGDFISICATYDEQGFTFEYFDSNENEYVGEFKTSFTDVPTQGEVFDWIMTMDGWHSSGLAIPFWTFERDIEDVLSFIEISSDLYPNLQTLYEVHVRDIYDEKRRMHGYDKRSQSSNSSEDSASD